MGRTVALDMGTVRIGVAMSDPFGSFAQGVAVWDASGDWIGELEKLLESSGASELVIGLPIREDGTKGPSASKIEKEASKISRAFPNLKIIFQDERYTSVIANRILIEGEVSRKKRKKSVDKIAASLILQTYLSSKSQVRP